MPKRKIIRYNAKLKEFARNLRNKSTLSEILLWKKLKGKQIHGYDFHRQKALDNYIVDFFCNELMLAIEIDGRSHHYKVLADRERQNSLESFGVHFLRFTDYEVKMNMNNVIRVIEAKITELEAKD